MVVDRFRVRPDLQQRLAESLETALDLAGGIARAAWMDDPERPDLVFSANYACPECGYSIEELEPRLFSFNNPGRRLPHLRRAGRGAVLRPDQGGRPMPS